MFRFSMDAEPLAVNKDQLATAGITEDEEWEERLKEQDDYREGERYYRSDQERPGTLEEAVAFVQGVFERPPRRVWLGEEVHEVEGV